MACTWYPGDRVVVPNPPTGTMIHVGYLPGITNADQLPCRAAVVTAPIRDGELAVTVFPAHSIPYVAKVTVWHSVEGCERVPG